MSRAVGEIGELERDEAEVAWLAVDVLDDSATLRTGWSTPGAVVGAGC